MNINQIYIQTFEPFRGGFAALFYSIVLLHNPSVIEL